MLTYLEWLLAATLTAQFLWVILRHFCKFLQYKKMWDAEHVTFTGASKLFNEAQRQSDMEQMKKWHAVCVEAVKRQEHLMRAQAAVMSDNFIAPWRWPERWNVDYLQETEGVHQ